ncbi:hypothetical protein [uncultured Brachyspira sp.]|uniref:hypothetical protein n=1 Tax=uncultured Brachyspira sp. TaxID=221953 RepID=UPI0026111A7A|nr:hypothetical protein [uncultured Brachyspira sp.]
MLRFALIFIILFSFNIYPQNIDDKPIKINKNYFTDNGNLKNNKELSIYAIRKIRFKDNSAYEMIILKNNNWYYYALFQIESNNKYQYIVTIAFNQSEGLIGNIVYKDNFFTVEHTVMSNLKMYITFKYNDDKKIYLDKASMIIEILEIIDNSETTAKQVNGNVMPNTILYKDVTMDKISKLLNLDI